MAAEKGSAPMLFVLSPAKALNYEAPIGDFAHTQPLFTEHSARLIEVLRKKSAKRIAQLMDLSEALSVLNVERYQAWVPEFTPENSRPAVLAFDGAVYGGLNARGMAADDLAWAQDHLCILSGLYGVLRPLDLMQPYRLEMGTALKNRRGADLYAFWGPRIAAYLNERALTDATPVVVNLASQEYFRAVDRQVLKARVIDCVFEDWKDGQYKIISFLAKRARGLMARYAIKERIALPKGLESFKMEGYAFSASASQPDRLVFRRRMS